MEYIDWEQHQVGKSTDDSKVSPHPRDVEDRRPPGPMKMRHLRQQQSRSQKRSSSKDKADNEGRTKEDQLDTEDNKGRTEEDSPAVVTLNKNEGKEPHVSSHDGAVSEPPKKQTGFVKNGDVEMSNDGPQPVPEQNAEEIDKKPTPTSGTEQDKIKNALEVAKEALNPEKLEMETVERGTGKSGHKPTVTIVEPERREKSTSESVENESAGPQPAESDLAKSVRKIVKKFDPTKFKSSRSKSRSKSQRRRDGDLSSVEEGEDECANCTDVSEHRRRRSRHSSKHRRHSSSASRTSDKEESNSDQQKGIKNLKPGSAGEAEVIVGDDEMEADDQPPQHRNHIKSHGASIFQRVKGALVAAKDALAVENTAHITVNREQSQKRSTSQGVAEFERKKGTDGLNTKTESFNPESEFQVEPDRPAKNPDIQADGREKTSQDVSAPKCPEPTEPDAPMLNEPAISGKTNNAPPQKDVTSTITDQTEETEKPKVEKAKQIQADGANQKNDTADGPQETISTGTTTSKQDSQDQAEPEAPQKNDAADRPSVDGATDRGSDFKPSETPQTADRQKVEPRGNEKPASVAAADATTSSAALRTKADENESSAGKKQSRFDEDADLKHRRARRKTPTAVKTDKINMPYSFTQKPAEGQFDLDDDSESNSYTLSDTLSRAPQAVKWAATVVAFMMLFMVATALQYRFTKKEVLPSSWVPKLAVLAVVILLVSMVFGSFASSRFVRKHRSDNRSAAKTCLADTCGKESNDAKKTD